MKRADRAPWRVWVCSGVLIAALSVPASGVEPDPGTESGLGYIGAVPGIPREKPATPLKSITPAYPVQARRFNVQGVVIARMSINEQGLVEDVEIVRSDADLFSDSVREAFKTYVYPAALEPYQTSFRVPFRLRAGEFAFKTGLRTRTTAPANAAEINQAVISGWSEMRLMIDVKGNVVEKLVVRSSSPEFAAVAEKIAGGFAFDEISATRKQLRDIYVNAFRLEMNYDGTISVFQRDGT